MRVSPFHSVKRYVHHNNDRCTEGNNIEREHWRPGTGNKPLCDRCAELAKTGR
jgi:hypothetical protein